VRERCVLDPRLCPFERIRIRGAVSLVWKLRLSIFFTLPCLYLGLKVFILFYFLVRPGRFAFGRNVRISNIPTDRVCMKTIEIRLQVLILSKKTGRGAGRVVCYRPETR